jgi:four helix bundle protein
MKQRGLDSLEVWQKSRDLAKKVCVTIIPLLPEEEKWSLSSQLRRSVQSIPANIAEGFGRYYYQEGVRFCYIARGSLEETYSHLRLANDLGYIPKEILDDVLENIDEIRRLVSGYIRFLKRSKRGEGEPGERAS